MDKIILFDLDGTLIDSTEAIYESFVEVFKKHNLSIATKEQVAALIGYPLDEMFRILGIKDELIESSLATYKEHYIKICDEKTTLLPNALESIKLASSFAHLGVVTTKASASSRELLRYFGVESYFSTIIGKQDVNFTKPNPEPINKAIERLEAIFETRFNKSDIFMIGDTILDLKAAQNAGVNGVGVLCGYGNFEDLSKFSKSIFPSTLEAVQSLKN